MMNNWTIHLKRGRIVDILCDGSWTLTPASKDGLIAAVNAFWQSGTLPTDCRSWNFQLKRLNKDSSSTWSCPLDIVFDMVEISRNHSLNQTQEQVVNDKLSAFWKDWNSHRNNFMWTRRISTKVIER